MKKQEIGDIQFWNEMVVHYRNMRDKSQTGRELAENLEMLKVSREELKDAEKRYLGSAQTRVTIMLVIITLLVLASIIFCSGCQTVQGVGGDLVWFGKAGQEALENGHKLMEK